MRKALLIIFTIIVTSISVAAQTSDDVATNADNSGQTPTDHAKEEDRLRRRWWVSMSLASVFDTNITHDEQQVSSFGLVPSFGFHFRDNPSDHHSRLTMRLRCIVTTTRMNSIESVTI